MVMSFVRKVELDTISKKIANLIDELDDAIAGYCDASEKMDSVISVLRKHYDTFGGKSFSNDISKIDFLGNSLEKVVDSAKSVSYSYNNNKEKQC